MCLITIILVMNPLINARPNGNLPDGAIDTNTYSSLLHEKLLGFGVTGYSTTLRNRDGNVVIDLNDGDDDDLKKTWTEQVNAETEVQWKGLSQIISAIAIIKAVDQSSVAMSDNFSNFLPARWNKEIPPGMEHYSIQELLSEQITVVDTTIPDKKNSLNMPPNQSSFLNRVMKSDNLLAEANTYNGQTDLFDQYAQFVLAYLLEPKFMKEYEKLITTSMNELSQSEYDLLLTTVAWNININHIKRSIFEPLGISATCLEWNFTSQGNSPPEQITAKTKNFKDMGWGDRYYFASWKMSSNELSLFFHKIKDGLTILNSNQYKLLKSLNNQKDMVCSGSHCIGTGLSSPSIENDINSLVLNLPDDFTATLVFKNAENNNFNPLNMLNDVYKQSRTGDK